MDKPDSTLNKKNEGDGTTTQSASISESPKAGSTKGIAGSLPNSPRERRRSSSLQAHPKPPRNSPAEEPSFQQQDPSPMASPSSVSVSSKTPTIRTGVSHHRTYSVPSEPPPALSLDEGSTFKLQPLSRPMASTLASPKLLSSPSAVPLRKATDSSLPAPQHPLQQPPIVSKLNHPPLPLPRKARRCPLFCCFYAEFDNVVGPKICYESPLGFMEQSTDVSLSTIHKLLASNFDRILAENGTTTAKKEAANSDSKRAEAPQSPPHQPIQGSKSTDSVGTVPVANITATSSNRKSSETMGTTTTQHSAGISTSIKESPNASTCDSIFDSFSDFIITGNELTGNIVNLSAFNMHLLTRPTVIHDKRYERNSLLFCVGFILRRTEDPRPFRPLLSKLALTLKRMEMESDFLSKHSSREQIQSLLDRILVSLNCTCWETNLVVNNNVLNLKLFHPPKYPASPVPDHAVPILMRRDWQVQMYDWDLAINWVVLHIDGVANARQISKKAEVDMEMVRNCLRVLKHHQVISVVDMFFYTNRYSPTKRAASLLAGHEPLLLQEAAEYVLKRPHPIPTTTPTPYSNLMVPMSPPSPSPTLQEKFIHPPVGTSPVHGSPITSSFPSELNHENATAASLLGSSLKYATFASYQSQELQFSQLFGSLRREEQKELKTALAELYCAFNRNTSFGDLWVALAAGKPRSQSFDRSVDRNKSSQGAGNENRDRFSYQHQGNSGSNTHRGSSFTRGDSTEISGSEGTREQVDATDMSLKDHYLDRLRNKSACAAIDWGNIFDTFDHRRFVSFGLVNGLLERVHNFPFLLDVPHQKKENGFGKDGRSPSIDETTVMARNVARLMDGLHCDDHIVSVFEKPFNELVDLVGKVEGKKVLSIYSVAAKNRR